METIFPPLQRIILLQDIEPAAGRERSPKMFQCLLRANGRRGSISEVNEPINGLENRGYVQTKRMERLHHPAVTPAEIVEAITDEAGEPLRSRSSMNRYAQRMKRFAKGKNEGKTDFLLIFPFPTVLSPG
ncbi:MAG: DUF3486 family protein [Treponema sp.]|jgi:hypothetical protein|nr:DUF3486 family protein [Treponema sp.]